MSMNYRLIGTNMMNGLRGYDYRLWFILTLQMLIPTVWITIRIHFVGDMPNASGIDIASQLMWIGLLYEIFQEALIVPLFYILGKSISDRSEMIQKIRGGLLIVIAVYIVFGVLVSIFADPLVAFMGQDPPLHDATVEYVRLETAATLLAMVVKFLAIAMITLHMDKVMYLILVAQMFLVVVSDTFLISELPFSLSLGVNGIAYSNMIVNAILVLLSVAALAREGYNVLTKDRLRLGWIREWGLVGTYSGLESFIRNLIFIVMVVRLVNLVSNQGDYWMANSFIWSWLLVPFLALGDVVKKQVAESKENIREKTWGYFSVTLVLLAILYASMPLWIGFIDVVLNADDASEIYWICILLLIPYTSFVFNNIMDSTFSGLGRTDCILIQSICVNLIYYPIVYILYVSGYFIPNLESIVTMFGLGVVLDIIPTTILYFRLLRREGIRLMESV